MGQALDIAIPPPRPKRKPSNPYPRKTGSGPMSKATVNGGKESLGSEKVSLPEVTSSWSCLMTCCCSVSYCFSCNFDTNCVLWF